MMNMKAFLVTEPNENTGGVVFAKSGIEARKYGANEWNGGVIAGMSVHRAPWADRYGRASNVPARDLIDFGWWFECSACGSLINLDTLSDRRLPLSGVIGSAAGVVYCCPMCWKREDRRRKRNKARVADTIEQFKARVRRRFGDVRFVREHAYCPEGARGAWRVQEASVDFEFPGMTIGPAKLTYRVPDSWSKEVGPSAPSYTCCSGDRAAFEEWARSTRPQKGDISTDKAKP